MVLIEGKHQDFIDKLDLVQLMKCCEKKWSQLAKMAIRKFESQIISKVE
jgi:hypothetical protein